MVFYEDFVKKVKEAEDKFDLGNDKSIFRANYSHMISNLGIGIPLILLGLFDIYSISTRGFSFRIIVSILILAYGLYILYNIISYKIEIDKTSLKDKKLNIDLDKVKLCELNRMLVPRGKKLQFCLSFYTEDKKEIILPLIMNKKLEFVLLIKKILGEKFQIIEDK